MIYNFENAQWGPGEGRYKIGLNREWKRFSILFYAFGIKKKNKNGEIAIILYAM